MQKTEEIKMVKKAVATLALAVFLVCTTGSCLAGSAVTKVICCGS